QLNAYDKEVGGVRSGREFFAQLQFRDGIGEILTAKIDKTQTTVSLREGRLFGFCKLIVRQIRGLGQFIEYLNGMLLVLLGLIQTALGLDIVGIVIMRDGPTDQHKNRNVILVYGQSFI